MRLSPLPVPSPFLPPPLAPPLPPPPPSSDQSLSPSRLTLPEALPFDIPRSFRYFPPVGVIQWIHLSPVSSDQWPTSYPRNSKLSLIAFLSTSFWTNLWRSRYPLRVWWKLIVVNKRVYPPRLRQKTRDRDQHIDKQCDVLRFANLLSPGGYFCHWLARSCDSGKVQS